VESFAQTLLLDEDPVIQAAADWLESRKAAGLREAGAEGVGDGGGKEFDDRIEVPTGDTDPGSASAFSPMLSRASRAAGEKTLVRAAAVAPGGVPVRRAGFADIPVELLIPSVSPHAR
jgi:hypothetical protein